MPNPLEFVILALAVWRVSSLLTYERGPGRVFEHVRARVGIKHSDAGHPNVWPSTFWGELLTCVWCASVWVALGFALLYAFSGSTALGLALPFALSGAAIGLSKWMR